MPHASLYNIADKGRHKAKLRKNDGFEQRTTHSTHNQREKCSIRKTLNPEDTSTHTQHYIFNMKPSRTTSFYQYEYYGLCICICMCVYVCMSAGWARVKNYIFWVLASHLRLFQAKWSAQRLYRFVFPLLFILFVVGLCMRVAEALCLILSPSLSLFLHLFFLCLSLLLNTLCFFCLNLC